MTADIFRRLLPPNRRLSGHVHRLRIGQDAPGTVFHSRWADWRRRRATRAIVRTAGSVGKSRRFLAARFRWISLMALVVVAGGAALSWSRTPTYHASAEVLVQSSILTISTAELPDMGSEKAVVSSGVVTASAARALHIPQQDLASGLSVTVPLDTHILKIGYTSTDPQVAQRRAQALAVAYVLNWRSRQASVLPAGATSSRTVRDTPATVIISDATAPGAPASPDHFVDVGVAVVVGLALGFGTALLRDRFDDGLRSPSDFAARVGAPLIALLPPLRCRRGDATAPLVMVRAPASRAADAYRDLRTHVLRAATRRGAKTLLVTSPSGESKTVVAANLAVALTQAGHRVTFVCADTNDGYGDQLLGTYDGEAAPRLLDARTDLGQVLRDAPVEGLRVLPVNALDNDHGTILQTPVFTWALSGLRARTDFVIIDSPPVLLGADAGAMAELAEMILVVGDFRRTTRRQIDATAHRLEHVRASVIGCVLDSFGRPSRVPAPAPLPPTRNGADPSAHDDGVLADVQTVAPVGGGEIR
ncbi:MAG: polysaccharide biosynthesis tyrosine autokinase [Pseudonocardiales bacterium]|nr:polysaccharide biosynthesis tyrosine autokinase [Pseudonocardiales bacterium]